MKIAIITNGSLPVPNVKGGGAETLLTYLLKQNEIYKKLDITVFCIENGEAKTQGEKYKHTTFVQMPMLKTSIAEKIKYRLIKKYPLNSPYSYKRAAKIIKKGNYDRVIIENTTWPICYYSKKFKGKLIIHLHNDWINLDCPQYDIKRFTKAINKSFEILVISRFMRNRVCEINHINREKVKIFYNATDIDRFSQVLSETDKIQYRKKYNIDINDCVILYSGRICEEKGILELLQAYESVIQQNKNVKLLIVGSATSGKNTVDEYTKQVQNKIKEIGDSVVFSGYINHEEIYKIYAIADIQVIPSMWEEPFGLVAIEGMAQGLPIICTNSGGLVEVVNEKSALIVTRDNVIDNLKNAMQELIDDEERRKTMGNYSYSYIINNSQFDLKTYYNNFINLLK